MAFDRYRWRELQLGQHRAGEKEVQKRGQPEGAGGLCQIAVRGPGRVGDAQSTGGIGGHGGRVGMEVGARAVGPPARTMSVVSRPALRLRGLFSRRDGTAQAKEGSLSGAGEGKSAG